MPSVVDYKFIKLLDVIQFHDEGILQFKFNLPETIDTLIALAMDVKYKSNVDYIWKAEIPEYDGSLIIVKDSIGIYGSMNLDTIALEFYKLNDSISLLLQHIGIDSLIVDTNSDTSQNINNTNCISGNECAAEIKILFLVPPDANNWYVTNSFRNSNIISMIEELNTTFQRSNISHRVSFAIDEFNWTYPKSNMSDDADELALSSAAITKRNENNADLVIMLTNHNYPNSNSLGYVAEIGPINSSSFGIVGAKHARFPTYTFVHEIGHLFGARHETHPRFDELCERDWEIKPNRFYTVMRGDLGSKTKFLILNFSDPEIKFQNLSTGSYGIGNPPLKAAINAGIVRASGCNVGAFKEPTGLSVSINGDNRLCENPELYKAIVTPPPIPNPGQPPYTYEWRWNLDGIFTSQNPGTLLSSTTEEIGLPPPVVPGCTFFFIKVKVTSGSIEGHAIKRIETSCIPCQNPLLTRKNAISSQDILENIKLFPNPSANELTVEWVSDKSDSIKIVFTDMSGNIFISNSFKSSIGINKIQLPLLNSIPAGLYILKLIRQNKIQSHKILVLK